MKLLEMQTEAFVHCRLSIAMASGDFLKDTKPCKQLVCKVGRKISSGGVKCFLLLPLHFLLVCAMPKDANSNGACPKDDLLSLKVQSESQLFFSCFLYRKESGLESFVPNSLAESMKRKELKKLLGHFLKMNTNLTAPGQKNLTALQAKLHYLKIISELPSYGAKCFSTTLSVSISHQRNQSRTRIFCSLHNIRFESNEIE